MSSVRSRRIRRMRAARYRRGRNMRILGVCALVVLGGGALAAGLVVNSVASELRKQKVQEIRLGQNTRVYDRDHHLLGIIASTQNRTEVRSRQIPKFLKNATVAIEDKRFYEHHGVDYYRLVGALVHNLVGGHQGGSTITMQLARNLMPGGANAPRLCSLQAGAARQGNRRRLFRPRGFLLSWQTGQSILSIPEITTGRTRRPLELARAPDCPRPPTETSQRGEPGREGFTAVKPLNSLVRPFVSMTSSAAIAAASPPVQRTPNGSEPVRARRKRRRAGPTLRMAK